MSRNFLPAILLLFYLILLLMCCAMCESASAQETAQAPDNKITLFNPTTTKFKNNGDETTFKFFTSPSLGYVGNVLVVFAQAKNSGGQKCDIVEGYFEIKDNDGSLSDKDEKSTPTIEWKKQVTANEEGKCAGDPTLVFDKENIYLFFKNSSGTEDGKVEYWIKGGKFNEIDSNKGVKWEPPEDLIKKKNT